MLGPSGSGKSTLALAIAGLVPSEFAGSWTGSLEVAGLVTTAATRTTIAERVGIVFQDPASQIVMERVEDDVAFGLENRAWSAPAMRARVPQAIAEVGLSGFERRRTTRLSGGEQQRLALAGVLAPRPGILVLDEPTANLDPLGAEALFDRLAALRARRAVTMVLVEHRVDQARPLADRILALGADGAAFDVGNPEEVLQRSARRLEEEGIWVPRRIAPRAARAPVNGGQRTGTAAADGARAAGGSPPSVPALAVGPSAAGGAAVVARMHRVTFAYEGERPVIHEVSLVVGAGERIALVGPNGSGKSTLGQLLVGLLRPRDGWVRLGDDDPARLPAASLARRAGYVFQDPELQFLTTRVRDEVELGLADAERARVPKLMDALQLPLDVFGDRSPFALSGGEQRRLSLACALVRRSPLLVLDEPTFGQDRRGYEGLLGILRDRVEAGTAVLAATHDPRFVEDFATRIIRVDTGRIVVDERVPCRATDVPSAPVERRS